MAKAVLIQMNVLAPPTQPNGLILLCLSLRIHQPSQLPDLGYALLISLTSDCHIISQSAQSHFSYFLSALPL